MPEVIANRTTDNGQTLLLKRRPVRDKRKGGEFQGKYEYYVTEAGSNQPTGRFEPTRQDGEKQIRQTVKDYEAAAEADSGYKMGGGMPGLGGSNPGIPGLMGGMNKDDDDDEDTGFNFPGF